MPLVAVFSFALSHSLDILSQALDRLIARFFSSSIRMQRKLGTWLKASLPSILTPPEHTQPEDPTPLSLSECSHRRVNGPGPGRNSAGLVFTVSCQDPLLLDTQTGPFRTCPSASSLHLLQIPGRSLSWTLIVKITIRGAVSQANPRLRKRLKETTYWLQLLNKPQRPPSADM